MTPDSEAVARFRAGLDDWLDPGKRQARRLLPRDVLGVAVSGGPDSLALLLLAAAALPGRIMAATVDHGLRQGSAGEAAMVADVCSTLDVPHITLPIGTYDRSAGLQAGLRNARYRQLTRWVADRQLAALATGHHAGDQAETLIMRLSRGSGLRGLSAIRRVRFLQGSYPADQPASSRPTLLPYTFPLIRPLLHFAKDELVAIARDAGLEPVDDPSNRDPRYDRTRARHLLTTAPWLEPRRLSATIGYLQQADDALEWATAREYQQRVTARPPDFDLDPVGLPAELLRRVVRAVLLDCMEAMFHSKEWEPSGPELTMFIARLETGVTATLAGIVARPGKRLWRFRRAPARRDEATCC